MIETVPQLFMHAIAAMVPVALSLGAINALIPLIVVLIFIGAAAAVTRGFNIFEMFGIRTLLGVGTGKAVLSQTNVGRLARGSGRLSGKKYKATSKKVKTLGDKATGKIKGSSKSALGGFVKVEKKPNAAGIKDAFMSEQEKALEASAVAVAAATAAGQAAPNTGPKATDELAALKARYPNEQAIETERKLKASMWSANTPLIAGTGRALRMSGKEVKNLGPNRASKKYVEYLKSRGMSTKDIVKETGAAPSGFTKYATHKITGKIPGVKKAVSRYPLRTVGAAGAVEFTSLNAARMNFLEQQHNAYTTKFNNHVTRLANLEATRNTNPQYAQQKKQLMESFQKVTKDYYGTINGSNERKGVMNSAKWHKEAYSHLVKAKSAQGKAVSEAKAGNARSAAVYTRAAEKNMESFYRKVAPTYSYEGKVAGSTAGAATIEGGTGLTVFGTDKLTQREGGKDYNILGIDSTASNAELKRQYYKQARTVHPDMSNRNEATRKIAEEKMKDLNLAWGRIKKEKGIK